MGGFASCFSEPNFREHLSASESHEYSGSSQESIYSDHQLDHKKKHTRSDHIFSTNFDFEFLYKILQWDTHWLDDSTYEKGLPPIIGDKSLFHTSLCYEDFADYYRIMEPLILHEFYHVLKKDIHENNLDNKGVETRSLKAHANSRDVTFIDVGDNRKMLNFTIGIISSEDENNNYPLRGDLVKVTFDDGTKVFGYIHGIIKTKIHPSKSKSEESLRKNIFVVRTKELDSILPMQKVELVTVISMQQYLRFLGALKNLPKSPLFNQVIQPKIADYEVPNVHPSTVYPLISGQNLNRTQLEVIACIVKAIEKQEQKICLVEGPPGTGKTTVIVNIISQILKAKDRKILICAPSNNAVDGVVSKMLDIRNALEEKGIKFNIVRVGREEKMDPALKHVSLQTLAGTSNLTSPKTPSQYMLEETILANADIIASTLASCYTFQMESIFGKEGQPKIPVCIIDEAGQANELETLVPLLLGVETLILVGDPKQLPPIIFSPDAKKFGLDISLFARVEKNFEYESRNSHLFFQDKPIKTLNVQYRMNDQIASWPNKFFYSGRISSEAKIPYLGLCHYKVFDHTSPQSTSKYANEGEAQIIVNLLVGILDELLRNKKKDEMPSISVITPYFEQKGVIMKQIKCFQMKSEEKSENNASLLQLLRDIQVNTVDSFQGQEKDVIIMSCVRSNGIGFVSNPNRLNVSLTRAKHTMILCGNFTTFRKNFMWRDLLRDAEYRDNYVNVSNASQPRDLINLILEDENGNIVKRN